MFVGRNPECARIEGLFAAATHGKSSALVIRGEPGSGKSALLEWAVSRATGLRRLDARGEEAESDFAFSGLQELTLPIIDALPRIPDVQAKALGGALALAEAQGVGRLYVGAATLSLLAAAAEDRPIVCVIEDAQWLDQASADALTFAARRIEAEGIVMLFAAQEGSGPTFMASGLPELRLGGLERDDAMALLGGSGQRIAAGVAAEVVDATGGNPLALVEIPKLMTDAQRTGRDPLRHPLPVGPALTARYVDRVSDLSSSARRALLLAAACDTRSMRVIARSPSMTTEDLEECEAADLMSIADGRFEFRHPLLRHAAYWSASPAERRAIHADLAEAFGNELEYRERSAWHLAASTVGPDEEVAGRLAGAAQDASDRRAHVTAAAMFERSARLTPDAQLRAGRLLGAARSAWLAGQAERASTSLSAALEGLTDPLMAADASLLRAKVDLGLGLETSIVTARLKAAADDVEPLDKARASEMYANASLVIVGDDALAAAKKAVKSADQGGRTELLARLALGRAMLRDGHRGGATELQRARELLDTDIDLHRDPELLLLLVVALEAIDADGADVGELLHAAEAASREHALVVLPRVLVHQAWRAIDRGAWHEASIGAFEAARLFEETGQLGRASAAETALGYLDALHGREVACRDRLARIAQLPGSTPADLRAIEGRLLGLLALGRGDASDAVARSEPVADEPAGLIPDGTRSLGDLFEALVRTGDREGARAIVEQIKTRGEGIASVYVSWCDALLSTGDAERSFARAVESLDRLPSDRPFVRARIALTHGESLRRAGERIRARRDLRAALETFEKLGAETWADRARHELAATGEKLRRRDPSGVEELTPQELHVATVIADGATYKEAAAHLFLSPKTIEFHLSKVYRKLGISSRRGLSAALARHERTMPGSVSSRAVRTFMFTDIVGSTHLIEAIGDDAWTILRRWHDVTVRRRFVESGGEEIDHAGDGFFVAFNDAGSAIRCAVHIQRDLDDHRRGHGFAPQIRIGLHTTEATRSNDSYTGRGVHAAARIVDLAGGDEIVASLGTLENSHAVERSDPRSVTVQGIAEPIDVVSVRWQRVVA